MSKSIQKKYRIRAPLYRVWRYFQDGTGLQSWFAEASVMLEPRAGGVMRLAFGDGDKCRCEMTAFVPGKTFGFRWSTGGALGAPRNAVLDVMFRLSEAIDAKGVQWTTVELTESGYDDRLEWMEYYAATNSGWTYYLMNLKCLCETGYDLRG